jgi:glycosyltransferase involved in cell wall biosynthesis
MAAFYRSLDIFVHSARQEPLGRVLLVAAACGVPVIATRVGGTEEIFPTSDQAILIRTDDTRSLAQETQNLAMDGELRLKLGKAGFDVIKKNFNIRDVSQGLNGHYQRLLEGAEIRRQ